MGQALQVPTSESSAGVATAHNRQGNFLDSVDDTDFITKFHYNYIGQLVFEHFLIVDQKFHRLIVLQVIGGSFTRDYCVQDADTVTAPTKVMKILYYANMLAGELDGPELMLGDEVESAGNDKTASRSTMSQIPQVSDFYHGFQAYVSR